MKENKHSLVEYLYVDVARLNSYFEQISSPITYEKIPIWRVALGLTGPKTETTQSRPGRPFTHHEKILKIVEYINTQKLVFKRERKFFEQYPSNAYKSFGIETIIAHKAIIPSRSKFPQLPTLNIWISLTKNSVKGGIERYPGALYLIEDFHKDDNEEFGNATGYSALFMLSDILQKNNDVQFFDYTSTPFDQQKEIQRRFASNPIEFLTSLGAHFGPKRHIHVIYRVRAICIEINDENLTRVTIGYPIVISEALG